VVPVRYGHLGGAAVVVALLVALTATAGVGVLGWATGLCCGAVLLTALHRWTSRVGMIGPADFVTLTRAGIACALAAVVVETVPQRAPVVVMALAVPALLLDAIDGRVARRTGTASAFGARFDGEADAFLLLVLSVYVAPSVGVWVAAIGAARYVFGAAGWALPWLRAQLPPRPWRKVVTAVQGIALAWAASGVAAGPVLVVALAGALALLTESFGRDVWWLWRQVARKPVALRAVARETSAVRVPAP